MIISNQEIRAGETKTLEVNIARLPSHTPIDISIIVSRAKEPGPVILLSGGLHGDEINGIEVVRRLIEGGDHIPTKGTIITIPIINIYGFIHFSRYVPDGKDVNRSFPGNKNGSLASRVAYFIMSEIIPHIDFGIDFHTGGADRTNYPQIRCLLNDPELKELAMVFQAPFIINSKYRPKSIRREAARKGKKILVYEGGESARFDEFAIQQGVEGAKRVLKYLGMRQGAVKTPKNKPLIFQSTSWIRARYSGLFQASVSSGQKVAKKQLLGSIMDPFGDFKISIPSPQDGYIIGLNNNPIVHQGDAIIHLGIKPYN